MVAATSYTFHIVNFYKPDSLYNYGQSRCTYLLSYNFKHYLGMQPLLYSEEAVKQGESGWTRVGQSISYHPTNTKHVPDMKGSLYTLTWTMVTMSTCCMYYKLCQKNIRNFLILKTLAIWLIAFLILILNCCHIYQNWKNPHLRHTIFQGKHFAILWLEMPVHC